MIRAILIDDEQNALEVLQMQLQRYCPQVDIVGIYNRGEKGIEGILDLQPQLVFLDIEMPTINGFDVLLATKKCNYQVVFTTAYDQFAIQAFKHNAIDYLLKPIDIEELKTAVDKIQSLPPIELLDKVDKLFQTLHKPQKTKLTVPIGEGYELIRYQDIIRCESDSNYTTLILVGGKKIILTKTLKEVESTIDSPQFFRIHHSHLIHLDHIVKFFKTDGGYVLMSDGCQINISRAKRDAFFERVR